MTPETDKLDEAIDYVQSVAPTGGPKLRKFLNGLARQSAKLEILTIAMRPEGYYYSWPGWKPAARAWILMALVRDQYWVYGHWQKPSEGVIQGYLSSLKTKYQPEIDNDIRNCFSFGPSLQSLDILQESDKRKLWAIGSFSKPSEHKDSKFRYIVYAMVGQTGLPFMKDGRDSRSDYVKSKYEAYVSYNSGNWTLN